MIKLELDVAALEQDPSGLLTSEVLDQLALTPPEAVDVYATHEARVVGKCVRFWREKNELWAELHIEDGVWTNGMHGESMIGIAMPAGKYVLGGVILTGLKRGELHRAMRANQKRGQA